MNDNLRYSKALILFWLSYEGIDTIFESIKNGQKGLCIGNIVIEPSKHPHYYSAEEYCIGLDSCGKNLTGYHRLSGSPSAWNEYEFRNGRTLAEIILDMFYSFFEWGISGKECTVTMNANLFDIFDEFIREQGYNPNEIFNR